jgi:hypothetical protein
MSHQPSAISQWDEDVQSIWDLVLPTRDVLRTSENAVKTEEIRNQVLSKHQDAHQTIDGLGQVQPKATASSSKNHARARGEGPYILAWTMALQQLFPLRCYVVGSWTYSTDISTRNISVRALFIMI